MGHALAGAQQLGGQVQQHLVHQPFSNERAVEFVARFEVQFVDFAPGQIAQHRGQIDFATGAWHVNHRHAHGLQCRSFFCVLVGRGVKPDLTCLLALAEGFEQSGIQGDVESTVHHHQMRLARHLKAPHIELGVVFQHGANARQDGAGPGTPSMAVGACVGRCDPLALAILEGTLPVQRGGHFHAGPRAAHASMRLHKSDVQLARLNRDGVDRGPGFRCCTPAAAKRCRPCPATCGLGVGQGGHHPADACCGQRVATRAGAPLVGAGLQGSPRLSRLAHCDHVAPHRARP